MKNNLLFLLFFLPLFLNGQSQDVYFADHPTLSPDGSSLIFSYEGDLWQASTEGGQARRLTAMDGLENNPKFSPDGRWVAFSANQFGNSDVFVMNVNGGQIRQLTYHQSQDVVSSWDWDSQTIYFTSDRFNRTTTFSVPLSGGTPKRLFGHYFNNPHNLVVHPKSGDYYFNESWESDNFAHRKGYKGAFNPDIKSYNPTTQEYVEHTDYEGKDFDATIDKNGNVYFVSDEYNGEYNLYTFNKGKKKRLTSFETSIKRPFASADGDYVVFQKDYQLFLYDVKNGKSRKIDLQVVRNNTLEKAKDFNVKGNITDFSPSEDGKKLAFVSRGELFVSDIKGKYVRQLKTRTDGRVSEVYWLKDNKTLIFNQTVNGYQNWFTIPADGKGAEKQLTGDQQNNRLLSFNSDRTKAVYLSGRNEVRLMDMESMESELLVTDELWGFYNSRPRFASDDRHVLYNAYVNFEQEIMLLDTETKSKRNLTQTGVTETSPFLSPDGKYLYFTSNRTKPSYPFGLQEANIYRIALQKNGRPFKSDKFEELFKEEKEEKDKEKEDEEDEGAEENEEEEKEEKPALEIDYDDLMERIESIGVTFGNQGSPYVIQKDDKTIVLYTSNHDEGQTKIWMTEMEPFERPKTEQIKGGNTFGLDIKTAKDKYYTLIRGAINEINLGGHSLSPIEIDYTFRRQLNEEFRQMFYETWANLEENFYDENFHGVDWAAKRDHYAQFLPHITNRADLRRMTNDMLGELNTSHFGFYSNGDEEDVYYGSQTLATGIHFKNDAPFTVDRLVRDSPADRADLDVREGDVLVAINGETVDNTQNREFYFAQPSRDEEMALTFKRGEDTFDVKVHPTSFFSIRNNLYDEWMDARQKMVDEKSNKRIAYVHMKNMGGGQLQHFLQQMVSEGYQRDGLILDLRYNTGGNVHDEVLRFLAQKPYLQWKYREGELTPQSNFGPAAKPIVLLINEQSLSDAEMTATGFKELKLGAIIGTETYRWIIFTSGAGLVDGSFYRLPSWGCYTLEGENLEKTGVAPDIFVDNNFKHRLEGSDPQLERAIMEILKQL